MHKRILTASFVVALTAMTAWAGDKTVELNVKGMSCEACPPAVSGAVKGVKGVKACNVDLKSGKASVTADESVKNEDLVKAVADAGHGFTAEVVQ
jgi:periplasmic mercuric ion binding protein